jgi:hypothetical protein
MMVESVGQEKRAKMEQEQILSGDKGHHVSHRPMARVMSVAQTLLRVKIREILYEPRMLCLSEQPGDGTPLHKKVNNGIHQRK